MEQGFGIRKAGSQFGITRRAVGKGRFFMRVEGENVPQQDVLWIEAVIDDGAPNIGVSRFVHPLVLLGAAGHESAVGAARPFSLPAEDDR